MDKPLVPVNGGAIDISRMSDDQLLDFAALVDAEAPKWDPAVGEGIVGVVIKRGMVETRNYGQCGLTVLLSSKDGKPYSIWEAAVLSSKLTELKIRPGDKIAIKRLPDRPSKERGANYKNYAVVLAGRQVAPAAAADPPPALQHDEEPPF